MYELLTLVTQVMTGFVFMFISFVPGSIDSNISVVDGIICHMFTQVVVKVLNLVLLNLLCSQFIVIYYLSKYLNYVVTFSNSYCDLQD